LLRVVNGTHPNFGDYSIPVYHYSSNVTVDLDSRSRRLILGMTRLPKEVNDYGIVPKWSEEKVLGLAKEAKAILMVEPQQLLGKPKVEFSPAKIPSKYSPSYWRVFWPRASRDGYEWINEGIQIRLSEQRGVEAFGDGRWTELTEPPLGSKVQDFAEWESKAWRLARETVKAKIFKAYSNDAGGGKASVS
jgi:hypothetical protein